MPDWSDRKRLGYTLDLAYVLAALLPNDVTRGSISTLPLGWRSAWSRNQHEAARRNLDDLARGLAAVEANTGRCIRVGFEPEPGCVVETSEDAATHLRGVNTERLGVCLDACHLAVTGEEPRESLSRLAAVGLDVVKLQASCALIVPRPRHPQTLTALEVFAEDRFLHQVQESADRESYACDDLCDVLRGRCALPGRREWRVHFHVPLHAAAATPFRNSSSRLEEALRTFLGGPRCITDHVEIETYTWHVLPPDQRPRSDADLVVGIGEEISWVRDRVLALGLQEVS